MDIRTVCATFAALGCLALGCAEHPSANDSSTSGWISGGPEGDGSLPTGGLDSGSDAGSDAEGGDGDGADGGDDGDPPESPYIGGWDIGECQDSIIATAVYPGQIQLGDVLQDWLLVDQFGELVRLYDFCHKAVYYEIATLW